MPNFTDMYWKTRSRVMQLTAILMDPSSIPDELDDMMEFVDDFTRLIGDSFKALSVGLRLGEATSEQSKDIEKWAASTRDDLRELRIVGIARVRARLVKEAQEAKGLDKHGAERKAMRATVAMMEQLDIEPSGKGPFIMSILGDSNLGEAN